MRKYNYDVVLETLLGQRKGTMQLVIDEEKVNGFLSILEKTEPCCGTMDHSGLCKLSGKIVTLLKEFAYTATGYIDEKHVDLILKSGKSIFQMTGTASSKMED